jgi:hypothetical protein
MCFLFINFKVHIQLLNKVNLNIKRNNIPVCIILIITTQLFLPLCDINILIGNKLLTLYYAITKQ